MKKTRILALLLAIVMVASMFAGCGKKESTKLRVAVQSFYCSSMVEYIQVNELDKKAGLDIEWLVFNGGAPINEAMGEWDIAVTGGAFVYALANYDCKLVAHQVDGTAGNNFVCRTGDPLASATTKEEMAAAVKGKTILTCIGTTGHYTVNMFLASIGLNPEDVTMMNLEIPNVYASWVAGEGDYAVLTESYCYYDMDAINTVVVGTLESSGGQLLESTVCTSAAYKSRKDDIVKFVKILYDACDALAADEDLAVRTVVDWYKRCGKTITEDEARASVQGKPFMSIENAKKLVLGDFAKSYAAWFQSRELIDAAGLAKVGANIASDVLAEALK